MKFKEYVEKKNELIERAESIVDTAKKENRELTDAEAQELAEIRDDVRKVLDLIKTLTGIEEMALEDCGEEPQEGRGLDHRAMDEQKRAQEQEKKDRDLFESYLRARVINQRDGELTPAEGSGQVLIPATIAKQIIKKVYDISPVLDRSAKFNVKGTLNIPYYDTSVSNITVAYASEFSPLASHNGKFTTIELKGFLAGALSKISRSLINNTDFNIVDFVVNEMAECIARFIDKELLAPSDPSHKVTGLSDLANKVQLVSEDTITADDLVKLHDAVKDRFQSDAIWVMSPSTRTACRLLKDSKGRYMLQDDVALPFGSSILGKPVYVSDQMPDIATGVNAIYYGDFKGLATKFSEDINIEVLREKYADEHAVGVVGWFEFDAKVSDAQKIARLVMG